MDLTQSHACYTMATYLDEKCDLLICKELLKTSIDLIWVTWEVRG